MKTYTELLQALIDIEKAIDAYLRQGGEVGTPEYRALHRKSDAICYAINGLTVVTA